MKKYYYYVYKTVNSFGSAICYSESGEFEICEKINYLKEKYGTEPIITFYKEISSMQYEKLKEYFENERK